MKLHFSTQLSACLILYWITLIFKVLFCVATDDIQIYPASVIVWLTAMMMAALRYGKNIGATIQKQMVAPIVMDWLIK